MSTPAVVLRSKFVTPGSNTFNDYINYIDREDAKRHIHVKQSSKETDDFYIFHDFMDYMEDEAKQGQLFTSDNDQLNQSDKKLLKQKFQKAQQNESPMWQDVISFDNEWLAKQGLYHPATHTVNEVNMRKVIRGTMHTVLKAEGMEKSAIWTASLHYNTDNIHVHIASTEAHPTREKINVFDKETQTWHEEYRAKRKPKTLDKMKSKVANMILDRTKERNKVDELVRGTVHHKKENGVSLSAYRKTKELFQDAMEHLPTDKRQWQYGYQSINDARPYIDEITNIYLQQFHAEDMNQLHQQLDEEVNVMKEMYGEGSDYETYKQTKLDDLKKRMGNALLAEMREYDKAQNDKLFHPRQFNRLHSLSSQEAFADPHHTVYAFNASMMKLSKAMRRTFHDYQKDRNLQEFDRIMDGYE
ncbi:MobP2 family relaxase [Virgibacillus salexigens]|uniref:MobP2 family relaxase n=1 Tax=Virgibacillus salexigens TaxID=61016 RepID=UPI00190DD731|nr:MobP2 family relaxase [Virgibacillus salexigens]